MNSSIWPIDWILTSTNTFVREDLWAMAMKEFYIFRKAPGLESPSVGLVPYSGHS